MNNGMANPMMNNNAGGMGGVTNAFGSMNMAGGMQQLPQQQPAMAAPSNDDDFGDFSTASKPRLSMNTNTISNSSDPMSKLINLDGLSKNASAMKPANNQQQQQNNMMGGNPMMGNQMPQNAQPGKSSVGYALIRVFVQSSLMRVQIILQFIQASFQPVAVTRSAPCSIQRSNNNSSSKISLVCREATCKAE